MKLVALLLAKSAFLSFLPSFRVLLYASSAESSPRSSGLGLAWKGPSSCTIATTSSPSSSSELVPVHRDL
jgi:hypothetical protein